MQDSPVLAPPPTLSGDDSDNWQIAYWVIGILVTVGSPLISAWWAARRKRAEEAAEVQRTLAEERAKLEASERERIAQHYARESEQQVKFYDTLMQEVQALRSENVELKNEIRACKAEVKKLEERLEYYERNPANAYARQLFAAVMDAFDRPVWLHDLANNNWYLNWAYCQQFGVTSRKDFWEPINLFGLYHTEDIAGYAENDMRVVKTNTSLEFTERVRKHIMNPECEDYINGRFRKSPVVIGEQPFVMGELLEVLS